MGEAKRKREELKQLQSGVARVAEHLMTAADKEAANKIAAAFFDAVKEAVPVSGATLIFAAAIATSAVLEEPMDMGADVTMSAFAGIVAGLHKVRFASIKPRPPAEVPSSPATEAPSDLAGGLANVAG